MSASPISLATVRFFTQTGTLAPLAFGKLWSYAAGTNTPQALYSDAGGLTPLANPVILDANGEAQVWMGANAYKFNLLDAANVQQANWPQDNISSSAALAAAAQAAAQAFATAADTTAKNVIRAEIVAQTNTYYVTTGTSPNFVLTPTTVLGAYTAGVRFAVKFHATALTGATLNVSTLGAKDIRGYDSYGAKVSPSVYADQLFDVEYDGTDFILLGYITKGSGNTVRQCLLTSKATATIDGTPNFLPATSATLVIAGTASATEPVIVTSASGFDGLGPVDRYGIATSNLSWTVPANSTSHLYVDVAEDGTLTAGASTTSPFYQRGIATATKNTSGAVCFDVSRMEMTLGSGTAYSVINRVYLGKAVSNATAVTSIVSTYFRDNFSASGVGTFITASTLSTSTVDIYPPVSYGGYSGVRLFAHLTVAALGYPLNSEIPIGAINNGAGAQWVTPIFGTQVQWQTTSGTATMATYTTGAQAALAVGVMKMYFSRGW